MKVGRTIHESKLLRQCVSMHVCSENDVVSASFEDFSFDEDQIRMKISQLWVGALRAARLSWEGGVMLPSLKSQAFRGRGLVQV
jgi:hypothetical protein